MNAKRKKVEDTILKYANILDPSGSNAKRYTEFFKGLSDPAFHKYMENLRDGKTVIYMYFPNFKLTMNMNDFLKAADEAKVKVTERIVKVDPYSGKEYTTPYEYLILKLPIRRTKQFLGHKAALPQGDSRTNAFSGQVIKPEKAASLSQVEVQLLHAKGLDTTITELFTVRGGSAKAYQQFKFLAETTGEVQLNYISTNDPSQSSQTVGTYLNALMFENNFNETSGLRY